MSTVLVVQGDRQLNHEWCEAVESCGHSAISANAIVEGIHRVREGGIDVILVDHGDSDRGLTEFVSELDKLPDPPPFVLISSSPQAPEISAHLGAASFLPKPCPPDEIIGIVNRFGAIPVHRFDEEPTQPGVDRDRQSFHELTPR